MTEKELIASCIAGNKKSFEELISTIQPLIFNISLRFLWTREDAEDATQEILIKIITNLTKFNNRSKLSTWAYRVATNYLINLKQTAIEKSSLSFDSFSKELQSIKEPVNYDLPDKDLLEKEMKTGCTLAMLQCLNRDLRMAFILGSILKLKSNVACEIVNTTPENFRKRLEKSRKLIGSFLSANCGVYNPKNRCRCNKRIPPALAIGRINRKNLSFAAPLEAYNEEMEELNSISGIYKNHGNFKSKSDFLKQINKTIATKKIFNANE
ncbi:sigma-70 family RNA polymerase sigma factor [Aquimarina sp. D1M17]|uniref:RNA polymerase sigma factor n=1 Tax=Aquimarina acroporae TaxID=2937283 RepID=UPI0020C0E6A0|nr:sigma-70 family RNA polymerase sigma factor [Aquimarina acroporae]MCK8520488.1 sigma-70 family RNA polymerase sigma factor [Aquimarina acroporae]